MSRNAYVYNALQIDGYRGWIKKEKVVDSVEVEV